MRTNKCGNHKVVLDGIKFDSQKEAARYCGLRLLEKAGEIKNLEMQKKYILIPAIRENGKLIEHGCAYIADFVYEDVSTGETVVEDVKGYRDPSSAVYAKFVIKRKLMLWLNGIRVREI